MTWSACCLLPKGWQTFTLNEVVLASLALLSVRCLQYTIHSSFTSNWISTINPYQMLDFIKKEWYHHGSIIIQWDWSVLCCTCGCCLLTWPGSLCMPWHKRNTSSLIHKTRECWGHYDLRKYAGKAHNFTQHCHVADPMDSDTAMNGSHIKTWSLQTHIY